MFISLFCSKQLMLVPVSFPLVPCTFSFISLCTAFTSSSIFLYSIIFVSIWLPVFWTLHLIGWLSFCHFILFLEFWSVLSFGPYVFVLLCLLHIRGRALGIFQGRATMSLCCGTVHRAAVWVGTMLLAQLLAGFQSLPPLSMSKLGLSGADSWVGGFVYILGPCGSLPQTLLWGWEFLPVPPHTPQVFSVRGFEAFFSCAGTLGCKVCLTPQLFLPVYLHANMGPWSLPAAASPGHWATTMPTLVL